MIIGRIRITKKYLLLHMRFVEYRNLIMIILIGRNMISEKENKSYDLFKKALCFIVVTSHSNRTC